MKARVAGIAGSVLALTVIGGFAAASTFQSVPDAPAAVQPVTVATVEPTVEPVVVPTTVAPAPVESTQAPVQAAPTSEAPVAVKSPAPKPASDTPAEIARMASDNPGPLAPGQHARRGTASPSGGVILDPNATPAPTVEPTPVVAPTVGK